MTPCFSNSFFAIFAVSCIQFTYAVLNFFFRSRSLLFWVLFNFLFATLLQFFPLLLLWLVDVDELVDDDLELFVELDMVSLYESSEEVLLEQELL